MVTDREYFRLRLAFMANSAFMEASQHLRQDTHIELKANGFARSTDSARAPLKSVDQSSLSCGSVKLRKLSGQATQFELPLMES